MLTFIVDRKWRTKSSNAFCSGSPRWVQSGVPSLLLRPTGQGKGELNRLVFPPPGGHYLPKELKVPPSQRAVLPVQDQTHAVGRAFHAHFHEALKEGS